MKNNKKKGFTLVELLVVIAILAILATVSVVGYSAFIERATVSNDDALASQLTNALIAYKVNENVTNANELKAAIEDFFEDGYLKNLSPQSAKYGYHFWYDIKTGEVIAARAKDLDPRFSGMMRPLLTTLIGAEGEEEDYSSFASGSFRIFGRYYLLDGANEHSVVVNAINKLEDPTMTRDEWNAILSDTSAGTKEAALQQALKDNLSSVAIHNQNGVFTNNTVEDAKNNVTNVYYPEGTESLGENTDEYKFDKVESAEVPFVGTTSGTLNYFNETTTINMNVDGNTPEEVAQKLEEKFKSSDVQANNLTITITTNEGTTYEFKVEGEKHVVVDIETNGENVKIEVNTEFICLTHLVDYTIYVENHDGKYAVAWDEFKKTDKTIQMDKKDFTSDNDNKTYVPDKTVTWDLEGEPTGVAIDKNGLITGITGPCTFTVVATSAMVNDSGNHVTKTYEIRIGEINGFYSFKDQNGSEITFNNGTSDIINHKIVSGEKKTFTFTVTPHYSPEDVTSCDDTILCSIESGATYKVDDTNNTVTVEFEKAGEYTLEVSYKEYPTIKRYIKFSVTNEVDSLEVIYMNGTVPVSDNNNKGLYVALNSVKNQTLNVNAKGKTSDGIVSDGTDDTLDREVTWTAVGPNGEIDIDPDGKFTVTVAGEYTIYAEADGKTDSFTLYVEEPRYVIIDFNGSTTSVMKDKNGEWKADELFQMSADDDENTVEISAKIQYNNIEGLGEITPTITVDESSKEYAELNGKNLTIKKPGTIKINITTTAYPDITTVFTITALDRPTSLTGTIGGLESSDAIISDNHISLAPTFDGQFTITGAIGYKNNSGDDTQYEVFWTVDQADEYIKIVGDGTGLVGTFERGSAALNPEKTITITATVKDYPDGTTPFVTQTFTVTIDQLTGLDISFGDTVHTGDPKEAATYLETATSTIYVYHTHTAPIVITPAFTYANGSAFNPGLEYEISSKAVVRDGNELTLNPDRTSNEATVTVMAATDHSIKKTFTVKVVEPENAIITLNNTPVAAFGEYAVSGGTLTNGLTLEYIKGQSTTGTFAVSKIDYTHGGDAYVSTGLDATKASFNTTAGNCLIEDNVVTIETDAVLNGTQDITVTIGSGTNTYTGTITASFNDISPVLAAIKGINTLGNNNVATLGHLFALIEGETIVGKKVTVNAYEGTTATGDATALCEAFTATADWAKTELNLKLLPAKDAYTIKVEVEGRTPTTLTVKAVDGKNVLIATDWCDIGGNNQPKALVLLSDITTNTAISVSSATIYGNYKTVTTSYNVHNSNFITMSSGTMNNVIIDGPVYPHLVMSSGKYTVGGVFGYGGTEYSTTYFCHGVVVSGTSKINGSYISGFRAPVRITSGTLTLDGSVLEGGVYASLLVYQATSVTLNNSKIIQNIDGYEATFTGADGKTYNKVIGAGVFLETTANSGVKFYINGDTHFYTWLSKKVDYSIDSMDSYVSTLSSKASSYMHSTNYVNLALFQEKSSKSSSAFEIILTDSTDPNALVKQDNIYASFKYFTFASYKHGDSCSCSSDITFTYSTTTFKTEKGVQ